jgi:hypothetical protein
MANSSSSPKFNIIVKQKGIDLLYSRCSFLKQFNFNPSMAREDEWLAVGTILVKLGDLGVREWERLSKSDPAAWNNLEFNNALSNIRSGVTSEYTCSNINHKFRNACNKCPDYSSPKDILLEYAANRKQGTISSNITPVDLQTARKGLESDVKSLFANLANEVYHIGPPNGVGKTTSIINELPGFIKGQALTRKVLFLVPRHNLAEEIEKKMRKSYRGQRINIVTLMSRKKLIQAGKLNCPHAEKLIKLFNILGYFANRIICGNCANKKICEYYKRIKRAAVSNIVIGVHSHMQYKFFFDLIKPDLIIIDECFIDSYRTEIEFKDRDIMFTEKIIQKSALDPVVQKDICSSLQELIKGNIPQWQIDYSLSDTIRDVIANYMTRYLNNTPEGMLLFDNLAYLVRNKIPAKLERNSYKYIHAAEIPTDIPLVILDSTTNEKHYRLLLGRNVHSVSSQNIHIKHNVEVTQCLDGAYPRSSLYDTNQNSLTKSARKLLFLMATILGRVKLNIITHRHLSSHIEKNLYGITRGGLVTYFGNVSGLNVLEKADAIIILGFKMIGFTNLVNTARVKFDTGWDSNAVSAEILRAENDASNSHMEDLSFHDDSVGFRVPVKKYSNQYVQSVSDIIEHGDYLQALGRIRPYGTGKPTKSSKLKYRQLFIISNQPTGPVSVDRAVTISELGNQYIFPKSNEQRDSLIAVSELLKTPGFSSRNITASVVAKKAGLKPSTVRSQFYRHGIDSFIKIAKALNVNPSLKTLMLGSDYSTMTSVDVLVQRVQEYSITQNVSNYDQEENLPNAQLLEITEQILNQKCESLETLANDQQFLDIPYEERARELLNIINKPIELENYYIGFKTFRDLVDRNIADDEDCDPIL